MSVLTAAAAERASFSWVSMILGSLPVLLVIAVVVVIVLLVQSSKKSSARPQQPMTPPQQSGPSTQQTTVQVRPPMLDESIEAQLTSLKRMVEKGLISQQDYEAKKKQLLGL